MPQGMLRIHARAQLDGALGWVTLSSSWGGPAVVCVISEITRHHETMESLGNQDDHGIPAMGELIAA